MSDSGRVIGDCYSSCEKQRLEAEIERLKTMYDELKRAVWYVPGEPRHTEQELEAISHQSTKDMATDQSLYLAEHSAGEDPVRLYQQIHALESENHLLREELGR